MKAKFVEFHNIEKLDELFEASEKEPIVFYKHSTSCSISANVFREVSHVDSTVWVIVVQDSRHLSNEFAERTGIRHESPQAIVIKDRTPKYNASHYDISSSDLEHIISRERANG